MELGYIVTETLLVFGVTIFLLMSSGAFLGTLLVFIHTLGMREGRDTLVFWQVKGVLFAGVSLAALFAAIAKHLMYLALEIM